MRRESGERGGDRGLTGGANQRVDEVGRRDEPVGMELQVAVDGRTKPLVADVDLERVEQRGAFAIELVSAEAASVQRLRSADLTLQWCGVEIVEGLRTNPGGIERAALEPVRHPRREALVE